MKYFAYGMNTNLDEMTRRCPGAVCLGSAWIDNYEFAFRTHADITKKPGARCHGVLWEITPTCLQSLDALEGFPYYYTRFHVKVSTSDMFVYALIYQMTDQSYVQNPGLGYLETVTEGYEQNSVPTDQITKAINMICSSSTKTNLEYYPTWYAMTKDFV
jgi:gamma-glutamylcyclotransferase (GGCT)/AIG2-like uncharacterized protein YtfP